MTPAQQHYSAKDWSSYADGELPAAQREEMRAHLETCAECAMQSRSFNAVQRGAEELARRAEPPPATLRSRLLAVSAELLRRDRTQWFWVAVISIAALVVVGIGAFWTTVRRAPPPQVAGSGLRLVLDRVVISRIFIDPAELEYEVTIENENDEPLAITAVAVRDPFGDYQRQFNPPVVIAKGVRLSRQPFAIRTVPDDAEVIPGIYRIWLSTSQGTLTAARTIRAPR